jgi:hypothetical protein
VSLHLFIAHNTQIRPQNEIQIAMKVIAPLSFFTIVVVKAIGGGGGGGVVGASVVARRGK